MRQPIDDLLPMAEIARIGRMRAAIDEIPNLDERSKNALKYFAHQQVCASCEFRAPLFKEGLADLLDEDIRAINQIQPQEEFEESHIEFAVEVESQYSERFLKECLKYFDLSSLESAKVNANVVFFMLKQIQTLNQNNATKIEGVCFDEVMLSAESRNILLQEVGLGNFNSLSFESTKFDGLDQDGVTEFLCNIAALVQDRQGFFVYIDGQFNPEQHQRIIDSNPAVQVIMGPNNKEVEEVIEEDEGIENEVAAEPAPPQAIRLNPGASAPFKSNNVQGGCLINY